MSMYGEEYSGLKCGKGMTKQSPTASCDINSIVARYRKTGFLEHARANPGIFADVSQLPDFQGLVSKVRHAQEAFDRLPSGLRARFHNDPGELITFCSDSENRDEAIKLGIIPKPVPKDAAGKAAVVPAVEPVAPDKAVPPKEDVKEVKPPK